LAHSTSNNPGGGKPDKLIRDALMGAIRQGPNKLKKGVEILMDRFEAGELEVIKFVTDRIDGKASESITMDHKSSDKSMSPATSRIADFLAKKKPDANEAE
jgi:hypothetical protein